MSEPLSIITAATTVLPLIAALLGYFFQSSASKEERKRSRQEIAEAESRVEQEPERAKPAWDLARITLEAYFNRNLSQISAIFWLSVLVMLVGFSLLAWGLAQAVVTPSATLPATLATSAGVVTEFIGATFLFIYRSTITQAVNYSRTLERINSVGMAMQILDTMPDTVDALDLRSKTKADLVQLLVKQAYDATRSNDVGSHSTVPQRSPRKTKKTVPSNDSEA